MSLIGHNRPPADAVGEKSPTGQNCPVEPFNLDHRPYLSQMDIDGIVAVIKQLEAELVPLREQALVHRQIYNLWHPGANIQAQSSGFAQPFQIGNWDNTRFRELQSVLADCRIELRERRAPHHPEAKPSAHEQNFGLQMTAHASQSHSR